MGESIAVDDVWFISEPVPDQPGWSTWTPRDKDNYNAFLGVMHKRVGGDGFPDTLARVRMFPQKRHRNLQDVVHGGTMMGFIDCALFGAMRALKIGQAGPSVTVEMQTYFVGPARMDAPLEARVEVVRETGSMLFMNGVVVQGEEDSKAASFSAIIKKGRYAKAPQKA
ncbi:PaaI family thioesterase [Alterisphingorhabdus coralli]|uniref:PaaI family thioesterase n=1 Tax=Alterisphingorhabdus coralli TaxID=3071408 RepID=A0AA97I1P0_9SPHN|nr:PaaI family thioesterase [Parasphingorhabdus sp. SCSIO 66989]WOE76262.1 PaaI family thioesterase [Parasphingorhabdus sp. SCSIO 66989]